MILGHAALAVLARRTVFPVVALPLLLVAAYGPDLIDKAGMLALGTSSKYMGHTLLVFVGLATMPALLLRPLRSARGRAVWLAVVLLWASHLLFDLTDPAVLCWPLLGPFPPSAPYDLADGFVAFYTGRGNAAVLALDLACLAGALAVALRGRRRRAPAG